MSTFRSVSAALRDKYWLVYIYTLSRASSWHSARSLVEIFGMPYV